MWRVLALTVPLLASIDASADHPTVAFGSEASGPINTLAATPIPVGKLAFGLRNEFIQRNALSDARLAQHAEHGVAGVHSVDAINNASAALAYGLTESWSLSVRLPWISRHDIREGEIEDGEAEAHAHGDAAGVGDVVALASWRAWHAQGLDFALQLGLKAPSGTNDESDAGVRLETEFQPGSGSWDALFGAAVSATQERWSLHANILFNLSTNGAQDTELGDALFYNLAAVYALNGDGDHVHGGEHVHKHVRWDAVIELNAETRWRNEVAGVDERNSGGTVVYLSPGLRASYDRFGAFFSVGYPVIDEQRGIQTDVDFRLVGGVSVTF